MNEPRIIEAYFAGYAEACINPDAGKNQRIATRQAFFGGFLAAIKVFTQLGDAELGEDEGLRTIDILIKEAEDFVANLERRE